MCHRSVPVIRILLLHLLVAVPQEDRIVHRNAELQNHRQRLRDERDLPEHEVAAEVPHHRKADAQHKKQRNQERIHCQQQHDACQKHRNGRVDHRFALRQMFHIRRDCRHAADITVFGDRPAHLVNGFQRPVRRGRIVKKDGHDLRIVPAERLTQLLRENLLRHAQIGQRFVADHICDMADRFQLLRSFLHLPRLHPLRDHE